MSKKRIIDTSGTPLTPSKQGRRCLGNGEHAEYECCCDECDYYLYCFPQYGRQQEKHYVVSSLNWKALHLKK